MEPPPSPQHLFACFEFPSRAINAFPNTALLKPQATSAVPPPTSLHLLRATLADDYEKQYLPRYACLRDPCISERSSA